jgi:hypothetical protein
MAEHNTSYMTLSQDSNISCALRHAGEENELTVLLIINRTKIKF